MSREHEAAVVPLAVHLRDDVEKLIALQPFVIDVELHVFHAIYGLRSHPNYRFSHHFAAVSLVKLYRRRPRLDETANR